MEAYVTEPVVVSRMSEEDSHTWLHHVILLLDAAVRQIDNREESAKWALIRAKSLLRKQVDPDFPEVAPDQRGRFLAWQARKVHHYIDEHIADALSVSDVAALLGLSEAHFSRSFKRTFGEPPYAFVIRRRLERAIQYMLETDLSLSDIAQRCGFVDQPHLCKNFRRSTGHTPAAWRRACLVQARGTTNRFHLAMDVLQPNDQAPGSSGVNTQGTLASAAHRVGPTTKTASCAAACVNSRATILEWLG